MPADHTPDSSAVQQSGLRALDWVLRFAQDTDPDSPEYGGVRNVYNPMRRDFLRRGHGLCLTWSACLAGFAALAAYDLTDDDFYLDRVNLIARYVKSNQNLDRSDPIRYGSFVVSRDRRFVDIPDLSWAGNLFVHLYRRTGDPECLDRAKLAADWLLQMRMPHGGFATFFLLDSAQPVDYSHASDGQHGLFLANLHDATRTAWHWRLLHEPPRRRRPRLRILGRTGGPPPHQRPAPHHLRPPPELLRLPLPPRAVPARQERALPTERSQVLPVVH